MTGGYNIKKMCQKIKTIGGAILVKNNLYNDTLCALIIVIKIATTYIKNVMIQLS